MIIARETAIPVRYKILALLFLVSLLTFLDRVNISVAGKYINEAYGFSPVQYGIIFSAFVAGYMFFQLPGGYLSDRFGPRAVLTGAILWWSAFTVLTALAGALVTARLFGAFGSFILVRFLIGIGEGVAFPASSKVVSVWIPYRNRALANGILLAGIGAGSALTPPLIIWIISRWGWQSTFYICGTIGVGVALLWHGYARNTPQDHPGVNKAELEAISDLPEKRAGLTDVDLIVKDRGMLFLSASYFVFGYIIYIYYSWFFLYLVNVKHIEIAKGSVLAAMPFLTMAITAPLGGYLSDRLCNRMGFRGRKILGVSGMAMVALTIALGSLAQNLLTAVFLLSAGAGFLFLTVGSYWAAATDLHPDKAGSATGFMNTLANVGGIISPTLTPLIAEKLGWDNALIFAAALAIAGSLLWIGVRHNTDPHCNGPR
ncbi:MAG TPA: MFS transporter [Nitrospirota bacterium]|nr:MFS transporter [Nitrospirota bacterium]